MTANRTPQDEWFEVLAGRDPSPGTDPALVREAQLLRDVLLKPTDAEEPVEEARARELWLAALAKADASGETPAEPANVTPFRDPRTNASTPRVKRWHRPMALAASVAALAVFGTFVLRYHQTDVTSGPGVVRGDRQEISVAVEDPEAASAQSAEALRQLGLTVERTESDGLWVLETDISEATLAQAQSALRPIGIQNLRSGPVSITFRLAL